MNDDLTGLLVRLRVAVGGVHLAGATDSDLLARFVRERDDSAFAELVRRHGPAVLAECRSTIPGSSAADDVFQAAFLVLARRAADIRHPDRLGGWLRGVARRIALRVRWREARRATVERPLSSVPEPTASPVLPVDLRAVLDEELSRLPADYRQAVLLCDVDGVSRREAARRLGVPDGTLSNRLIRARAMLGRRLLHRGVTLGVGLGAAVVPPRLLADTVCQALSEAVPPALETLVSEALNPMTWSRKLLAALVLVPALGAATVGVVVMSRAAMTGGGAADGQAVKGGTPATMAISADELAKRPQPRPRIAQGNIGVWAVSSDGERIVTTPQWVGEDSKIVMSDPTTGKEVASLDLSTVGVSVTALATSADGKQVYVFSFKGVKVWDTTSGKCEPIKLDFSPGKYVRRAKLSPDGKILVGELIAEKGFRLRLWDVSNGETIRTVDAPVVGDASFTFTDEGKTLTSAIASGKSGDWRDAVIEWDVATGAEKRRIDLRAVVGTDRGPPLATAVAYTADGKQLVVGGGFVLPEKKLNEVEPNAIVSNYPWSGSVWVIDRESGKLVKTLVECRHDLVRSVHLTADGKKVIVRPTLPSRWDRTFGGPVGDDHEFVELQQWDVAKWELDWVKIVPKTERWKLWNGAER